MCARSVLLDFSKSDSIDIEFSNLVYTVQEYHGLCGSKKTILKGVQGLFKSGEITAIMGSSGAGKSTLLNILTGFIKDKNLKGEVNYLNSEGKKESWQVYKKLSCYILQDDQLLDILTVNESMITSINLKIGNSLNKKSKQKLIDDILETLDLTKCKNVRTSQLSGGQRKRLSIALELVDNPPVMFLDEPTTGLDSSSALQCIKMLQQLTYHGKTIICTIHQPSAVIFELFNHIYLLDNGKCMYEGAVENVIKYFGQFGLYCPKYHNPADYMIEVVTNEYGDYKDKIINAIESNRTIWRSKDSLTDDLLIKNGIENKTNNKITVMIKKPSELTRFWILVNRYYVKFYRDWTIVYLRTVIYFILALIIGLFFENFGNDSNKVVSNVSFLMVQLTCISYINVMPAVLTFPLELALLRKELFNNWYQLRTYYFALLTANLPIQLLLNMIMSLTTYFLSNQPPDCNRLAMFFGICFLTALVSESFGLLIGSLVKPINGTFISVIILSVYLMFAGFFVLFNHMNKYIYYFTFMSYLRYSLEALIDSVYGYNRDKLDCPPMTYCYFRIPEIIFREFGMSHGTYWYNIFILIVNMFFYRIVNYFTLKNTLSTI